MLYRAEPLIAWTWCIVPAVGPLIFGIVGAVGAATYWRYTGYAHPAMLQVDWIDVSIYAAAGFVVGWVVGFAISKIGHHDL